MFFAFSPCAFSRACVAVRKLRAIASWQVAHSSEPTNSAPGILGGARIVRLVVLQESRITASATAPPAPHNKLSTLPWIHRVSLEPHTNGEYAQKQKIMTTHFFGFSYTGIKILPMACRAPLSACAKLHVPRRGSIKPCG